MRLKKKYLKRILLAAGIIIIAVFLLLIIMHITDVRSGAGIYSFKENKMAYSENRGNPEFSIKLNSSNQTVDISNIIYKSRPLMEYHTYIHGLLFMPEIVPAKGIVLLPGGGVTKEVESAFALELAKADYAVLTIDQRGIGETGGYYLGFDQDYEVFTKGFEPVQHLSVYDSLAAYDVLRQIDGVDANNIAIVGESMGGRYALIAAATEKRFRGVVAISASGFHFDPKSTNSFAPYLISVDPDTYVSGISPRKLFMIHSTNDTVVAIQDAAITYSLAKEPKQFYSIDSCTHGYCETMKPYVLESLRQIFLG